MIYLRFDFDSRLVFDLTRKTGKMDSTLQKKRPVDTLTFDNWEEWFYLFFEWSKGEGIDYVLRKTVQQYAHIVT